MAGKVAVITYFVLLLACLHIAQSQEDHEEVQSEDVDEMVDPIEDHAMMMNNSNVQPPVTPAFNLPIPSLTSLAGSALIGGEEGSIYCYQCNSGDTKYGLDGPACDDPNKMGDFLKVCPHDGGRVYTRCRKMTQTVEGETRTIRSCATEGTKREGDSCIDRTGTIAIKITYCECKNEGLPDKQACNRSASLMTSHIQLFFFIAAIFVWFNIV